MPTDTTFFHSQLALSFNLSKRTFILIYFSISEPENPNRDGSVLNTRGDCERVELMALQRLNSFDGYI
mgnify:CR=1 FL=1